jgi:DNA topoisomerase-1
MELTVPKNISLRIITLPACLMSLAHPTTDLRGVRRRASRSTVPTVLSAAKDLGLRLITKDVLSIRRRRSRRGWTYVGTDNRALRDVATITRLNRLAVPPAYRQVLYAKDPAAHLQAVGRDAAGRLQYRYHPEWEKVREIRKTRRLERLAHALPRISRSIGQYLGSEEFSFNFACSAVIELVACSAIRPGSETYARQRGTRGAATLLKSNVAIKGTMITLTFRAKGGKSIVKEFESPRLAAALERLLQLPGRRLFQRRGSNGALRPVTRREVNVFLREIAGVNISLKDFRTLLASASVLEALACAKPASNEGQRRKQVMQAIRTAADELANTPAICRKSYVHATVVEAFEEGVLERFAQSLKSCRTSRRRTQVLAQIISEGAE